MTQLRIQIRENDQLVVHEFTRYCKPDSLDKAIEAAMGWLQAYGAQMTKGQYESDVRIAREMRDAA